MLSIGIIWNSSNHLRNKILADISQIVDIIDYSYIELGDKYVSFVETIYESENMEKWKIENKISHMLKTNNYSVTLLFFEFNSDKLYYHPFKKKKVYQELENCKNFIREKYKYYVNDYTFDIVFHATDDINELRNCYNSIMFFFNNNGLIKEKNELVKMKIHPNLRK